MVTKSGQLAKRSPVPRRWGERYVGARTVVLLGASVTVCPSVFAQDRSAPTDSVVVVPGERYRAGWLHRLLLGDHHRDLWTQPLKVGVLDLDGVAGGLTALCRGGGFQTQSLRFAAADGRQFVFRSVDKDPSTKLRPELRGTLIADILQDQISSHHPAGALVVAPLLDAVGVLHANPRLVVMPADTSLGLFLDDFAGVLGLLEERPRDGPRGTPGFAGSRRIEGTDYVWDKVEESHRDRIDARAFLTARLMDVYLGDWDRHHDQWRWARYPDGDGYVWRPIPRDRDQAFANLDGVILSLAGYYVRELVSFQEEYPSIFGLTWTGRALDRRFLVGLDSAVWDSVVGSMQSHLTDSVIEVAVAAMPAEIRRAQGEWLTQALKLRRELLPAAARQYYALLAEYSDIHATDEPDFVEINRLGDGGVEVRVYPVERGQIDRTAPYFHRRFSHDDAREIRIYLHGGDDTAVVRGDVSQSILIRVVGGGGDDLLADSSHVGGLPAPTRLYDARGDNVFEGHQGTVTDRRRFRRSRRARVVQARRPGACGDSIPDVPPRDLEDPFRDWGEDWFPVPLVTFNADLGLFVGYGAMRFDYGFRQEPYESYLELFGGFASGPGRARARFSIDTRDVAGRFGSSLDVRYSGIDVLRFHGLGNETQITAPRDFFKLTQRQVTVAGALNAFFGGNAHLVLGPFFKMNHTRLGRGNFIDAARPYGSDPFKQVGVGVTFDLDSRDRAVAATRGFQLRLEGTAVPELLDATSAFGTVAGAFSTYFAPNVALDPTLALRVGGKKVWGTFPFFEAAFLGGATTLRGFNEQRFAGDAAVYANAELRLFLTEFRLLLPGDFGIFGLADIGRVFLDGDASDTWHKAAGGGIWFAFIDRGSTISLAIAQSKEQRAFYASVGFML